MPIYLLGKPPVFPPPELATSEGIIAAGGDLSPQRLLNAYASGIFPWFSEGDPLLWWSPDPRMVLLPGDLHISVSMKKILKKNPYRLTYDSHFREVIESCGKPRKKQQGTWISQQILDAYVQLHELGFAHSAEVWDMQNDRLVGGLYGVSLGKCFFGESMFHTVPNASKYAFIMFSQALFSAGFIMLDCQVPSPHLERLGCRKLPRKEFLKLLNEGLLHKTLLGRWDFLKDKECLGENSS
jgi:leucyl/phenylalanyl-tRNA---protein transferase